MGIRQRIAAWLDPPEQRAFSSRNDALAALLSGGVAFQGGAIVSPRTAENLSTVLACVGAISSALASLPVWIYRRTATGRELDEAQPLMRVVRRGANRHQSWADFCEWLIASTLLSGNGLAEIITDDRGALVELRPIPWSWASARILPSGRLAFDVSEQHGIFGTVARGQRRLLQEEVLLLTDRSDDGVLGVSRLRRAATVIGAALNQQDFAASVLSNGVFPSGVITAEGRLDDAQRKHLRGEFRSFAGVEHAARALVLDQGLKWASLSISPEDQELLASRRFTGEELCRIYSVPPPIIGDLTHGTFTNSETLIRWFAQSALSHWARKLERALERQVLSEAARATHEVEVDLSGLLRGDPAERWQSHKIAVESGILLPNEVREIEGFDPLPEQTQEQQEQQELEVA
jgi:HK97 family phage portal protein